MRIPIHYDRKTERRRLARAVDLLVGGYIHPTGIEAGFRTYQVRSQSGDCCYKVYVGDDAYPTCTCRDWALNDWGDAYQGIPFPTYRCKHGLACLLWEVYYGTVLE